MVTHRGISGNTERNIKHPQSQSGQALRETGKNGISYISFISYIAALPASSIAAGKPLRENHKIRNGKPPTTFFFIGRRRTTK